ncbi:MAG: hypothetical protein ROD09_03035 [Candidatus Sedimenticola sp. (ex Thyasira tokunagai)]
MSNWKAITGGTIITIILILTSQLGFILVAAFIGGAKDEFAFLSEHKEMLWRLLALLSLCISMMIGGMATAFFSQTNLIRNALITGGLVSCLSLLTTIGKGGLTATSALVVILGVAFAAMGGAILKKRSRRAQEQMLTATNVDSH